MDLRGGDDIIARLECAYIALEHFVLEELGAQRPEGMSFTQLMIVYRLSKKGEVSAGSLHKACYTGSNVSYNLNALVRAGFISRAKKRADKRAVVCSLTEKGKKVADALSPIIAGVESAAGLLFGSEHYTDLIRWTQMTGNSGPSSYVSAPARKLGHQAARPSSM